MSNAWLHGPVPPDHPTAIKREDILNRTVNLIDGLSSYPAILGARQTGKTSLLYQLMTLYSGRFAFVFLDFQSWGDVEPKALYARILRQIAGVLPSSSEWLLVSNPQNAPDFQDTLKRVVAECPKDRLVFLCDELGGLQHEVALLFAKVARSIFTERLQVAEYSKISFVFTGGVDLDRLTGASSPVNNIVTRLYLEDFDLHSVQIVASACELEHLSNAIYGLTSGHPYLTQRLLFDLASVTPTPPADEVVDRLIQDGDPNIYNMLKRLDSSSDSVKMVVQRVLDGQEIQFSRITPQIAELEFIGLIRAGPNGECVIRSEIYRRAMQMTIQNDQVTVEMQLLTDTIPTGCCQNLRVEEFPLVRIKISNLTSSSADVHVSVTIPDYSIPYTQTVTVSPQSQNTIDCLPILNPAKIKDLSEISATGMQVTVKRLDTGVYLHDETHRILLHARDTALIALVDPVTSQVIADLSHHLCAWITPHAQGIEELLHKAADRHPDRNLVGYQGGHNFNERVQIVRKQVQTIHETLQRDTEVIYIDAALSLGAQADQVMQRVRLPSQTLEIGSANCIDGTVLFASLLECLGINPVLVIVSGHAYVGWEVWPDTSQYEYLETTMVGTYPFEQALQAGNSRTQAALSNGDHMQPLFHDGFWLQINVGEWRQQGIMPIE